MFALTKGKVAAESARSRSGTPKSKSWFPTVAASYPTWFIASTMGWGSCGSIPAVVGRERGAFQSVARIDDYDLIRIAMAERIDRRGGAGQGAGGGYLPAKVPCDRLTMKVGSRHHHDAGGVRCLQGEYRERGEKHH